jgi:amidophosphoribosyltransferase
MSGVIGIYSLDGANITDDLFNGLTSLQHRGEEGCGLSINYPNEGFHTPVHGDGLAYYRFSRDLDNLREIGAYAGIGHNLYEDSANPQPVEQAGLNHQLSMAMDGILLGFHGKNDAYMRTLFSRSLDEKGDFFKAGDKVMEELHGRGSYCVATLVERKDGLYLVFYRDPKGIKPYCLGRKEDTYIVASESKALDAIEAELIKDIVPGEMGVVSKKGFESRRLHEEKPAHCSFEWVYFADPTSVIEGRSVYMVRKALGAKLAQRYADKIDVDMVMASPDSGRGVALGFQQELSRIKDRFIPYEEASIKNPGAKRTFQVEDPEERKLAARTKFHMVKDAVRGMNVAVGDDSIVRGVVFRHGMVYKLRKAGAKSVIPVISCPPLKYPCIKDPKGKEFAAQGMEGSVEEIGRKIAEKLDVDMVLYPTLDELREAIGVPGLGTACFDGKYPVSEDLLL